MDKSERHKKADWAAAALLGVPALLEFALILHHPVPARAIGPAGSADPFGGLAAVIDANRVFHGVLIVLMLGQLTGLLLLAQRLGLRRALVVAGAVVCAVAAVLLLLATTYDGFVTYEIISWCRASAGGCGDGTRAGLAMILASVQAFTKLGLIAQSFGFAAFAASLLCSGGQLRLAGMAGMVIALAPLGLLGSGVYVGAALIMQVLVAHALFGIGAAFLLGSGRLRWLLAANGDTNVPKG
jgi:4-amino-4-deoxy-L-arabinose transferase-like glycosyltransferase